MNDTFEAAARQLLRERSDLAFFYAIYLEYSTGSIGDSTFHSLATDQQSCQTAIQQVCAEQKAERDQIVAELNELPEEEQPYDPLIPDGCGVSLWIVLPNKQQYVRMHSQRWGNNGQSLHSALIPDIFDVTYYSDKVKHGEYRRDWVKS